MNLDHEEVRALEAAKKFCRELLARKAPSGEQCVHISIALRGLETFPSSPDSAIELVLLVENDRYHEFWVLQVYGACITLSHGGREFSPAGSDSYTRFRFHLESPDYHALSGELAEFETVFQDLEWSGYRLYTKDESGRNI